MSEKDASAHQKEGYCAMCADNATKYNHCSWCGATFDDLRGLVRHLDDPNIDCIERALVRWEE